MDPLDHAVSRRAFLAGARMIGGSVAFAPALRLDADAAHPGLLDKGSLPFPACAGTATSR